MGIGDAAKDMVGKAKEAVGDATNNHDLERQGEVDQTDAKIGKAADGVKDAGREAGHKIEHAVDDAGDAIKRKL